jgi:ABC-2 type transport system ATP-binding protein
VDSPAIQAQNLHKMYDSKVAVRNLSLEVRRGEIFGFLGPNGAGKSTSVKMLLGLVKPSGGRAEVLGMPSSDVAVRRKIGFLPEAFRFYEWLTATELLQLHGRLCGVETGRLRERIPGLLEMVGLSPHRDKRLGEFSKGMLQRIGLAQALIHEPELIFLDEPTSGLDPMGRRLVREVIRTQRARGATVFLNSHLLGEVEATCDRVAFLRDGEIVASRNLREQPDGETLVSVQGKNISPEAVAGLARWCLSAHLDGERLSLTPRLVSDLPDILRHLIAAGADVYEFTPQRSSLEDLFMSIMTEDRGL